MKNYRLPDEDEITVDAPPESDPLPPDPTHPKP